MNSADTFKILVATDIHLGYAEKDPIRGHDTFDTFQEILEIAAKNEVDFLLLGGDLFHDSRPSPYCIYKCTELLKRYCLGERLVSMEFLSDPSLNFQNTLDATVNYENPNLNIALPVFSIHGNHDDPTGERQVTALDVVSNTGLINYFGRWTDITQIDVSPILLQKGETKLALFGLSHVKDERLGRLFRNKKVTLMKPNTDDWFNLLVLHQNRAERGVKNFIPVSCLPNFLNLVIWGHEHDCKIEPVDVGEFYISQPGSSVATSLAFGESLEKNVGLLEIHKATFKMVPIPLKTVRPFIFEEIELDKPNPALCSMETPASEAMRTVEGKIKDMILKAADKHTDSETSPPLPLIRLIVKYNDDRQQFNPIRLGQQFTGKVANPNDIVLLKTSKIRVKQSKGSLNMEPDENDSTPSANLGLKVEQFFRREGNQDKLKVISCKGMSEAVSRFVDNGDTESFDCIIKHQFKKTLKKLIELDPDIKKFEECIDMLRKQRESDNRDAEEAAQVLTDTKRTIILRNPDGEVLISDDSDDSRKLSPQKKPTKKAVATKTARGSKANNPKKPKGKGK